jgi:hypothetical protein
LDRNGLSVSPETACRFPPKSPVGNSEICTQTLGEQPEDRHIGSKRLARLGAGAWVYGRRLHQLADIYRQRQSVVEDVTRIRNHPLVPNDIPIYGYIYDVKSGKLVEVPEATAVGKAS